jgi:hypothetical protein
VPAQEVVTAGLETDAPAKVPATFVQEADGVSTTALEQLSLDGGPESVIVKFRFDGLAVGSLVTYTRRK